jgi:tetratricopeptide (TPR) repeat protein
MKMKRNLSLCFRLPAAAAVLAFATLPCLAQAPAPASGQATNGKIHGTVTNPTGAPQTNGTVSLSLDGGHTSKYSFPVGADGTYSGSDIAPGTYMVIYRQPDTPPDKMVDSFNDVKIVGGQDTTQDFDMSRKEFIDKLPPDEQKQLEDLRKHNSEALKANTVIKAINTDLKAVQQDIKEADLAASTASQQLGASASKTDVDAKTAEIKTAKYTDVETLMKKDVGALQESGAKVDGSILWAQLGQAQVGLKKYDDAEDSFKKALAMQATQTKPNIAIQGMANAGLGEIYARAGKVQDANAAFDEAAKVNPTQAGFYLRNEAVIFFQTNNADAQVAAAQEALKSDPNQAVLYYIIGQGLVQKATMGPDPNNPKVQRIILPPGCAEAYQKYLELAPNGPYANDAKGILQQAGGAVSSSYKAGKKS